MKTKMTTPRHHTKRDEWNKTLGGRAAKIAAFLGQPFLPWQRRAFDVALEIDRETGQFKYNRVLISVPRQCGKTAGVSKVNLMRTLTMPAGRFWYTAQTGAAARERWLQELGTPAESLLSSIVKLNRGAGDTRLTVPATGSQSRPMPPTAEYLHGEQCDAAFIDEPWAYTEATGEALLQAIDPTTATRKRLGFGTQLWFLSTAGTADSTWWHNLLDTACEDPTPGTCVIDYGISPETDPSDLEAVCAAHPGVAGGLIPRDAVVAATENLSPAQFARAYGNVRTAQFRAEVDPEDIARATTDVPFDSDCPLHIGAAVAFDYSCAAIVAVGTVEGTPAIELINHRPGTSWVVDRLVDLAREHSPESIIIDKHGPSGSVAEHLVAVLDDAVTIADPTDLIIGTESLMTGLASTPSTVLIRRNPTIVDEFATMRLRTLGDRGRLVSRKTSAGPIPAIEAAVLALRRALAVAPEPSPAPLIWSPS